MFEQSAQTVSGEKGGKKSISPLPFMKLLKMGRAAFTMMRDTRMNLDKYKRSCETEKAY